MDQYIAIENEILSFECGIALLLTACENFQLNNVQTKRWIILNKIIAVLILNIECSAVHCVAVKLNRKKIIIYISPKLLD